MLTDSILHSLTYDSNDSLISELDQAIANSILTNQSRKTHHLNASGFTTSVLLETWTNGSWTNSELDSSTYDASTNVATDLSQQWFGSAWGNLVQNLYTYDANNRMTGMIRQLWANNTWENESSRTFSWNLNNTLAVVLLQSWNFNTWQNYYLYTYTYQGIYQTYALYQKWLNGAWKNVDQLFTTYDATNRPVTLIDQVPDAPGSVWMTDYQQNLTYCSGNCVESATALFSSPSGTLHSTDSTRIFSCVALVTGIKALSAPGDHITLYPNPAANTLWLSSEGTTGGLDISITDVLGNVVKQQNGISAQTTVDISDLRDGIYFATVSSQAFTSCKKLVVSR